ncbi:MAG: hypothetical protein CVT88_06720 [Candidatus Altiarchaeales archaeon HGW-Altiarchaeales-1]|nr:MAG: hypothetical protein CVT89_02320 [Candidatus Altiarchaeales archaeon HGW-Altiarchaeales-2]PKP58780.1 MAG: hypothetical protein CVT88_06720 [Candidatus Altiarchaeales archaeon HGW-Altiarchaeales-1]
MDAKNKKNRDDKNNMENKQVFIIFAIIAAITFIIPDVYACPSPSCILDWGCVIDSNCDTSYQSCHSILHVCQAKEGFCSTSKDCTTGICNQTTHKCEITNNSEDINKDMQIDIFDAVALLEILSYGENTPESSSLNFMFGIIQKIVLEGPTNKVNLVNDNVNASIECLNQSDADSCIKNLALNYAKENYTKAIHACNYFRDKDMNDYAFCINGIATEVAKYDEDLAEKICDNTTDSSYAIHCITQISPIIAEKNLSKGLQLCESKGAGDVCKSLIAKMFSNNLGKAKEICNNSAECLINLAGSVNVNKEESLEICKNLSSYESLSCFVEISYKFYNDSRIYEICNISDLNSKRDCLQNAAIASKDITKIKELCNTLDFGKEGCLAYGIVALSTSNPDNVINNCNEIQGEFKITCLLDSGINVGKINKSKGTEICNYLKNISEGHGNWCLSEIEK